MAIQSLFLHNFSVAKHFIVEWSHFIKFKLFYF